MPEVRRQIGDTAFAVVCLLFSLFLLSQMWSQTVWHSSGSFAAQPGFWPRLAVIGMVLCSAANLYSSLADMRTRETAASVRAEVFTWARSIEFALWFMAYVYAAPIIGYLAATILFTTLLALRAGYRSTRSLLAAAVAAVGVVLLFKSFLQVKIPGGAVYEALPGSLRNIFILYF
ncbi:tripartite tricarboxylate transporter TctB family protein [Thioclava sp. FR2]|uniref:tripartite tricarboxylate transporter TctB family protein n=1 Tax=Thioclava sp. FR2 TaxID=3445780 RepID=UPI003EBE78FC